MTQRDVRLGHLCSGIDSSSSTFWRLSHGKKPDSYCSNMSAFWQQEIQPRFWADIFYTTYTTVRTAVLTPIIMLLVFTVLRLAGQRSLTESTLFNKITLVALGSLVGGTALRPNTPLVSVAVATVIIVGFTVAINHIYMRGWIPGAALRAHPIILWVNGETAAVIVTPAAAGHFVENNMRHCQMTREKVMSELRQKGYVNMNKLFAVVLEPPGKFAFIQKSAVAETDDWELLQDLRGYDEHLKHLEKAAGKDRAPNGCLDC